MAQKNFPGRIFAVVFLLILLGGAVIWLTQHRAATGDAKRALSSVSLQTGTIEDVVTAQGKLEPLNYVDVGAQVSGQLKTLHVKIGDTVKKGALLAEIDPELYTSLVKADEAKLKTLQAQMAQQQAQSDVARLKLNRNKTLIKNNAISQEGLEDAETALKVAAAQVDAIKAQTEEAQSTLEGDQAKRGYTSIYAPIDGTVVSQSTKEGQTLNASQAAPVIVQLANLDTMTVRAQVAEADVMRVKPDMAVYFTTLGSTERKWNGKVRQILPTPETVNDVVLYDVLVDVDNTDRQLMTGMSTQMFFVIGRAENVAVIPVGALGKRMPKEDNKAGLAYQVRVMAGKTAAPKIIHVGLMDRTRAEIKDGLSESDKVVMTAAAPVKVQGGNNGPPRGMGGGPRL